MHCSVYKGRKASDTYLFLPVRDGFDTVPATVLQAFGDLEHVMDLVLTPQRRLARGDVQQIMRMLLTQGCYVQLPPRTETSPAPGQA